MREPRDPLLKVVYLLSPVPDILRHVVKCNIDLEIQGKAVQLLHGSPQKQHPDLQCVHSWKNKEDKRAHVISGEDQQQPVQVYFNNDPSAGSPTETLLRLLLPLNDQV
jgi:hypothetical protein